jgi:hypothetical protein
MMMMGGFGLFIWMLLSTCLILGFALLVYIVSNKEAEPVKSAGMYLAATIAGISVVVFLYGGLYAPLAGRSACPMGNMGGGMGMSDKSKMMEKMMKDSDMMKKTLKEPEAMKKMMKEPETMKKVLETKKKK